MGWVDNPTTKQVTIMPAMYGDANLDGTVGLADLNVMLTDYGKSGMTWCQGDFNYDGTVGLADLNALLTNYGKSGPTHLVLAGDFANLDSQAIQALAGAGVTVPFRNRRASSCWRRSWRLAEPGISDGDAIALPEEAFWRLRAFHRQSTPPSRRGLFGRPAAVSPLPLPRIAWMRRIWASSLACSTKQF